MIMKMNELKRLFLFRVFRFIAEISLGYFITWYLLGIVGLIFTFAMYNLVNYLLPHIELIAAPFIDKFKDKLKIVKVSYISYIIATISLYPLFLYFYKDKSLFISMLVIAYIFVIIVFALLNNSCNAIIKYKMNDYEKDVYRLKNYTIVAMLIGNILGPALLFLDMLYNITAILIFEIIALSFLFGIKEEEGEIKFYNEGYLKHLKSNLIKIIKDSFLRNVLIFNTVYSLPNNLFNLFLIYLIYFKLHLPFILLGLCVIFSHIGNLVGIRLAYRIKINNRIMILLIILSDLSIIIYLFVTSIKFIPLVYIVVFLTSITSAVTSYYYSLSIYSLIPKENFATITSIISSISSIVDYIYLIISTVIISVISYYYSVLVAIVLFVIIDIFFYKFLTRLRFLIDKSSQ